MRILCVITAGLFCFSNVFASFIVQINAHLKVHDGDARPESVSNGSKVSCIVIETLTFLVYTLILQLKL